jgi:hypothetical protein
MVAHWAPANVSLTINGADRAGEIDGLTPSFGHLWQDFLRTESGTFDLRKAGFAAERWLAPPAQAFEQGPKLWGATGEPIAKRMGL